MENTNKGFWPSWKDNKFFAVLLGILLVYGIVFLYAKITESFANAAHVGFADQAAPTITVNAEGTGQAVPDVATVDLSAVKQAATVKAAQDGSAELSNALIAKLKELGILTEDIQTSSYGANPVYDYDQSPPTITAYEARQQTTVKIRKQELVGQVLSAAGDLGITEIGQLRYEVDDTTNVQNEARQEAISKARAQAEAIANAMGAHLGRVVSYSESTGDYYPRYAASPMMESMDAEKISPIIEPGQDEVTLTVYISYALE